MATPTGQYHDEEVAFRYAERALKNQLISSVKQHLLDAIDTELNQLCTDAVNQHVQISLQKDYNPASLSTNYFYSFVQKIVHTEIQKVVVKEVS